MQTAVNNLTPMSEILTQLGSTSCNSQLTFVPDPMRQELAGISVSYTAPTEQDLARHISSHAYETAGFTVSPSTRRKTPLTWDIAVGAVSWVLYVIACNRKELKKLNAKVNTLMRQGSKFLEPSADCLQMGLTSPVYAPLQQWYDESTALIFSLKTVSSLSPDSFISCMRDKGGIVIVEETATEAMEVVRKKYRDQFLNLTSHLASAGEKVYVGCLRSLTNIHETFETEQARNKALAKKALELLSTNLRGEDLFWKILKDITASGKTVAQLYNAKAWELGDLQKVSTLAGIVKKLTVEKLADVIAYEHLISWVMNVQENGEPMDYLPLTDRVCGWITSKMVKSFGFNLYAYNKDVLHAAFMVRNSKVSVEDAMLTVTEANGRVWKENARNIVEQVAESGGAYYENSDFETDFPSQLGKSLLPVSSFLLNSITALPQREKDGSVKRFVSLKELHLPENGRNLKECTVLAYQRLFGGKVELDKPDPIGVRVAETLSCSNKDAIQVVKSEHLPDAYKLIIPNVKVGDVIGMSLGHVPCKFRVKNINHKFPKRTGVTGLYSEGFANLHGLKQVLINVPSQYHGICEGFMAVHPDSVVHATGVYPGARFANDGWLLGENGIGKTVLRVLPWVPRDTVFVTPGHTKGKELECLMGSPRVAYMYRHDPNKIVDTNRAMFHRTDLMLHACGQKSMELNTKDVLEKLARVSKSLLGSVPCSAALFSMADKVVGNARCMDKGNLPVAKSHTLYGRCAYSEIGEFVPKAEAWFTPQGEVIMDLETFAAVSAVTGGPDQDDMFLLLLCTLEILRNPMCGGDGYVLDAIKFVEGF